MKRAWHHSGLPSVIAARPSPSAIGRRATFWRLGWRTLQSNVKPGHTTPVVRFGRSPYVPVECEVTATRGSKGDKRKPRRSGADLSSQDLGLVRRPSILRPSDVPGGD